ncbi:hypothetical protein C8039_15270 [Halogeometricum sp. wsp3]|nr:hypothetical protein C8039_15270 [Halogeometricum sp. wsp3]
MFVVGDDDGDADNLAPLRRHRPSTERGAPHVDTRNRTVDEDCWTFECKGDLTPVRERRKANI